MNGNITADGITRDLEAMKQVGVAGFQIFQAGTGIVKGPVNYGSPEHLQVLRHAAKEATRLGIEFSTRPGQMVMLREGQRPMLIGNLATAEELKSNFKANDWNQYHIVVRGYTFVHILNGRVISVTIDDDPAKRQAKGLIGLQIEGNNLKVSFRDIWLKTL